MALARILTAVSEDPERRARSASKAWRAQIGAAVKRAREERGMSQTTLADLIGANLSTISEIERGLTVPSLTTIWSIADRLGTPIDVLVGRQAPDYSPLIMPPAADAGTEAPFRSPWPALREIQRQLDDLAREVRPLVEERRGSQTKRAPKTKRSA